MFAMAITFYVREGKSPLFIIMAAISINVALARMEQTVTEDGRPVYFHIEFIKEDGSIRTMRAQKHVKHPSVEPGVQAPSKFRYNLKSKGSILLYDADIQAYRAVRIDRIIKFNDLNVLH
jgi:hypothetical protein